MSQLEVDKIIPQSGTTLTIGDSGDTISFADGATLAIDTNTLAIDSTNNRVGIGTSSPTQELHIVSTQPSILLEDSDNNGKALIDVSGGNINISADNTGVVGGSNIDFLVDNSQYMRISAGGDISFYEDTGTTPKFFWDASAERLGIGTSSPNEVLQVNSTSSTFLQLTTTNTGTADNNGLYVGVNADGTGFVGLRDTNGNPLLFQTENTERMRIDSSGNVGIGVTPENSSGTWRNLQFGGGNIAFRNGGNNDAIIGTGFLFKTDNSEVYKNTEAVSRLFFDNNQMIFQQASSGTAGNSITWSEAMRIDNSGNVGIGTTSPATPLDIRQTNTGGTTGIRVYNSDNSNTTTQTASLFLAPDSRGNGALIYGLKENADFSTNAGRDVSLVFSPVLNNAQTEAMRITSSGNVGIGTSSPAEELDISADAPSVQLSSTNASGRNYGLQSTNTGNFAFYDGTAGTNRMIIDSSGTISFHGISGRADGSTGHMSISEQPYNRSYVELATTTTTGITLAAFINPNGSVGSISVSGSSTAYNTSSDHRLKENVVNMTGATERLKQLSPKRFNFIADADTTVDGFLAHEVSDIVPEAITGTKDEVDEEGNPVYQGIDQSKLVPLLVATIKELEARITALENA